MATSGSPPAPATQPPSKVKTLLQSIRKRLPVAPPAAYITIADETVYFGAESKAPIQFRRDYAAEIKDEEALTHAEQLFRLFFSTGELKQPEGQEPLCDEMDFELMKKVLMYRFSILRQEAHAELGKRGATVMPRQKLGHLLKLKSILETIEDFSEACAKQGRRTSPPTAEDIEYTFPLDLDDGQIQELLRKFAFLILHAQDPQEGYDQYTQPARNIIEKLDSVEEPDDGGIYGYTEAYIANGGELHPIIDAIVSIGQWGLDKYKLSVGQGMYSEILQIIEEVINENLGFNPELKDMILAEYAEEDDPVSNIKELIFRLLSSLAILDGRKRVLEKQAQECQKKLKSLEKEIPILQSNLEKARVELVLAVDAKKAAEAEKGSAAAFKGERDALETRAREEHDRLQGELTRATDEIAKLKNDIADYTGKLSAADSLKTGLSSSVGELNARIASLEAAVKEKDAKITELTASLEGQTAAVADAKKVADVATTKAAGMEAELVAFRSAAPESEQAAAAAIKKSAGLEAALIAAQRDAASKEAALQAALASQKRTGDLLEAEKAKLANTASMLASIQAEAEGHRLEKEGAVDKVIKSEAELAAEKDMAKQLRANLAQLQKERAEQKAGDDAIIGDLREKLAAATTSIAELKALTESKAGVETELGNLKKLLGEKTAAYTALEADTKKRLEAAETACLSKIEQATQQVLSTAKAQLEAAIAEATARESGLRKELEGKTAADAATKAANEKAMAELRASLLSKAAADVANATKKAQEKAAAEIAIIKTQLDKCTQEVSRLTKELGDAKTSNALALENQIAELTAAHQAEKAKILSDAEAALNKRIEEIRKENERALAMAIAAEKTAGTTAQSGAIAAAKEAASREKDVALAAAQAASTKAMEDSLALKKKELDAKIAELTTTKDAALAAAKKEFDVKLAEAIAAKEAAIQAATTEKQTIRGQFQALLDAKKAEVDKKAAELATTQTGLATTKAELATAQTGLATAQAGLASAKKTSDEMQSKHQQTLATILTEVEKLKGQHAKYEKDLQEATRQKDIATTEVLRLTRELESAKGAAQKDLAAQKKQAESLLLAANLRASELEGAKSSCEARLAGLEKDHAALKVTSVKLEDQKKAAVAFATELQKKHLEKLSEFANEVLRGEFDMNKYASAEDKPLADLLRKIKPLLKTPMVGNDICVLMYFITYFLNTIFRANAKTSQGLYGQLSTIVTAAMEELKKTQDRKSDPELLFRLLVILQPYLFLGEKVLATSSFQTSETALYFIRTNTKKDSLSTPQFFKIYEIIKGVPLDSTLALNLVNRRKGSGPDIAFFPLAPGGDEPIGTSSMMVFEPFTSTAGRATTEADVAKIMGSEAGRRLTRYKVWEEGALSAAFTTIPSKQVASTLPHLFGPRPLTYDILFCMYIVATQRFILSLDPKKLKCPIPDELINPFGGSLPVPTVVAGSSIPAGSNAFSSAALSFGRTAKAASSAAVPASVAAQAPVVPPVAAAVCKRELFLNRSGDTNRGVRFSGPLIKIFSKPPYCFKDRETLVTQSIEKETLYNYRQFITLLNDVHGANPGLQVPIGFVPQGDGQIVPSGRHDTSRIVDLASVSGQSRGGGKNRTQKKKKMGKKASSKTTARNRR